MLGQADLNLGAEYLTTERNTQLLFLTEILQSVSDSDHDEKIVHLLLEKRIELLNEGIIGVLKDWVETKFTGASKQEKESIALNVGNFGVLIHDFPLGNKSVNLEAAITCYEIMATIFTVAKHPRTWAFNQNNLANAYSDRISGDRTENIEKAIAGYQAVLSIRTSKTSSQYWANTQNDLATAYSVRIKGDRAENIEKAIAGYQAALTIHTPWAFPNNWAKTKSNLAVAYQNRIKGDRAENIEKAIAGLKAALSIHTSNAFPQYWASAQNNLAEAYIKRIKGDKAENIEKAIAGLKNILSIYTSKDFPQYWAMIQNNLAEAYIERIVDEPAKNLQQALHCYQLALKIYTIDSFPNQWVSIQLKLAKLSIEKMHNYQMAMEHLEAAYEHLSINNSDSGLLAQTMFDMARCFHQTGCLDQAKIYFKDAIRIYQRLEQPTEVAAATSALGNLELQMGLTQDAQEHLQTALEFYQAAGQTDHIASIQALQQHLPTKLREIAS
jgi:tetratricopeptide (TPR) repeat protein